MNEPKAKRKYVKSGPTPMSFDQFSAKSHLIRWFHELSYPQMKSLKKAFDSAQGVRG